VSVPISGGGLDAVTLPVAELLLTSCSGEGVATLALLEITVPSGTAQLAVATSVTVALPPPGIAAKVTLRLLALPPHRPPPVAVQDTYVVSAGKSSVTTTSCA
jgi:hypothetical protein